MPRDPEVVCADAIRAAGYWPQRIVRIYPPKDGGMRIEVLFIGRRHGSSMPCEALTAYVEDRERPPAALIAEGW